MVLTWLSRPRTSRTMAWSCHWWIEASSHVSGGILVERSEVLRRAGLDALRGGVLRVLEWSSEIMDVIEM